MAKGYKIQGMDEVIKNLNVELNKIKGKTTKGLIEASIYVHRQMETVSPKIPIDTSNLCHSYFVTINKTGSVEGQAPSDVEAKVKSRRDPTMALGFGANYALFVHENMEARFNRPGSGPKFLETHLKNGQSKILEIIKQNIKIQ